MLEWIRNKFIIVVKIIFVFNVVVTAILGIIIGSPIGSGIGCLIGLIAGSLVGIVLGILICGLCATFLHISEVLDEIKNSIDKFKVSNNNEIDLSKK